MCDGGGYGFIAIRNVNAKLPAGTTIRAIERYLRIPVVFVDSTGDPESLGIVIQAGSGATSGIPEQRKHRPLVCGLQVQNFDDDLRTGLVGKSQMSVGTIGCFVRFKNRDIAFLSNNHVVAAENRGIRGKDRILQSGALSISSGDQVGVLSDFFPLRMSSQTALPSLGTARMNLIDAGWAKITAQTGGRQKYLASRKVPAPHGTAKPQVGDKVFKVGRRTGLTRGIVRLTPTIVGPVNYSSGPCWFRRSMLIESEGKDVFSDKGDSGSVIVRDDGTVIGLLFAGYGAQTYACPIEEVLKKLKCTLL
jgi:hypothetical protein